MTLDLKRPKLQVHAILLTKTLFWAHDDEIAGAPQESRDKEHRSLAFGVCTGPPRRPPAGRDPEDLQYVAVFCRDPVLLDRVPGC